MVGVQAGLLLISELEPRPARLANGTHTTSSPPTLHTTHIWPLGKSCLPSGRCLGLRFASACSSFLALKPTNTHCALHANSITIFCLQLCSFSLFHSLDLSELLFLSELLARFAQSSRAVFAELTFAQSPLPLFPTLL